MIIALDGCDGSGKSVAATLLRDYFSIDLGRKDVHLVNHPGSTSLGKELRRVLKSKEYKPSPIVERLIFTADGAQFENEFEPLHARGNIVICDRFNRITDLIYGAAGGLDLKQIDDLQRIAGEHLMADYYFPFQLPVDTALDRKTAMGDQDRIEAQGRPFASKVADQYNSIKSREHPAFPSQYPYGPPPNPLHPPFSELQALIEGRAHRVISVDATKSVKEILKFILMALQPALHTLPLERSRQ